MKDSVRISDTQRSSKLGDRQALYSLSDLRETAARWRIMATTLDAIVAQFEQQEPRFILEVSESNTLITLKKP